MKKLIMIIFLLSCNKNIKELVTKNKVGDEYWHYIIEGKVKELQEYIEKNTIDINKDINEEGEISLTLATKLNKLNIVNCLLNLEGIDVNAKNLAGKTALIVSILDAPKSFIKYEIIDKLLNKEADVNFRYGIRNNNTLMLSILQREIHVCKKILNKNVDINAQNLADETALILAIKSNIAKEEKDEIIKILIENDFIDFNIQDQDGRTALMYLIKNHLNLELFSILSKGLNSIDVNIQDYECKAAFTYAIESKNKIAITLLLQNEKINLDAKCVANKSILGHFLNNFDQNILKFFQNNIKLKNILIDKVFQFIDKLEKNLLEECYTSFLSFYENNINFSNALIEYVLKISIEQKSYKLIDFFIEFICYSLNKDKSFYKENLEQFFKVKIWSFLNEAFKNKKIEFLTFFFNKFSSSKNKEIFFNLHELNKEDQTILIMAAANSFEEIVEIILDFLDENENSLEIIRFLGAKDKNHKKAIDYLRDDNLINKYKKIEKNIKISLKNQEEKAQYFLYKGNIENYKRCLNELDDIDKDFKPTLHFIKLIKENYNDIALKLLNDKDLKIDFNKNYEENGYKVLDYILIFGKENIFYKIIYDYYNIFNSFNTRRLLVSLVESEKYSRENKLKILDKLLEIKEVKNNINKTNSQGQNVFSIACLKGDYEIVNKIVNLENLDLNLIINNRHILVHILECLSNSNELNYTPIKNPKYFKIIRMLLKKDVTLGRYLIPSINQKDCYLSKNIYKILEKSNYKFEDNEIKSNFDLSEIQQFLRDKNLNSLKKILKSCSDEDVKIFLNSVLKFPEILKELLSLNLDLNLNFHKGDGCTLLVDAMLNDYLDSLKLLVENEKTDINIIINNNDTPLIRALLQNKSEAAKIILENKNIKLYLKDQIGRTAFDIAILLDNEEVAIKILSKDRELLFFSLNRLNELDELQKKLLTQTIPKSKEPIYYKALINAVEKGYERVIYSFLKKIKFIPKKFREKYVKGISFSSIRENKLEILRIILPYAKDILEQLSIEASKYGAEKIIKFFISKGYFSRYLKQSEILLKIASKYGHLGVIKLFLKEGVNLYCLNTALMTALKYSHIEAVEILIKAGADVNQTNCHESTALTIASKYGHLEVVEILIKAGSDVNKKNKYGQTALMIASKYGEAEIVEIFIKAGAKVNEKDEYGQTALMIASRYDHVKVIEILIKGGLDVNEKDKYGQTALMIASRYDHVGVVRALIKAGAYVNEKQRYYGQTALMIASESGYAEVVEILIKAGADVNEKCDYRQTALMIASKGGYAEVVEILIKAGADVNEKYDYGQTAMIIASRYNHVGVVRTLVKAGADVNNICFDETALMIASMNGNIAIVKLLLKVESYIDSQNFSLNKSLMIASKGGHTEVVEILIKAGADVNEKDKYGQTALMMASEGGHVEVVEILMRVGVNVDEKDGYGDTSMMLALKNNCIEVIKILIEEADPNIQNYSGDTLLGIAASRGFLRAVKKFIKAGANLNKENQEGNTPLMLASRNGNTDIVKLLIEKGADINAKNKKGETAKTMAFYGNYEELLNLLPDDESLYKARRERQKNILIERMLRCVFLLIIFFVYIY